MNDEQLHIAGFSAGYYATDDPFLVWSRYYKRPLKPIAKRGIPAYVMRWDNGSQTHLAVETIAARVYLGAPPAGIWTGVRIDPDKPIARDNIRWVPQQALRKGSLRKWRPIPHHQHERVYDVVGFAGYTVRIQPFALYKYGVLIDPMPPQGTRQLALYSLTDEQGKTHSLSTWTVAARAFLGYPPTNEPHYGMLINPRKGLQPANLRWVTREALYSWVNNWRGTDEATRYLIYQDYWHGDQPYSRPQLAEKYGVTVAAVAHAIKGVDVRSRVQETKRRAARAARIRRHHAQN